MSLFRPSKDALMNGSRGRLRLAQKPPFHHSTVSAGTFVDRDPLAAVEQADQT
jgi:hypothetical protein